MLFAFSLTEAEASVKAIFFGANPYIALTSRERSDRVVNGWGEPGHCAAWFTSTGSRPGRR